jgi:cbb3-type cytochrome oxidase maturation protein
MNILLVLIPLSVLLALGAVVAFFWAVDHDQFDDLETPKLLPLLDDPPAGERKAANDAVRHADGDSTRPADSDLTPRT